jgi:hypothetical protein
LGEPARQLAAELGYELPSESEAQSPPEDTNLFGMEDAAKIASLIERAKQLSPAEVQTLLAEMDRNP